MVVVTFILDGSPQKIIQRSQTASTRWLIDVAVSAYDAIVEDSAQNIHCNVGYVAHSAILLEPNVVDIFLFHLGKPKVFQHSPIALTIDRNGSSLLVFSLSETAAVFPIEHTGRTRERVVLSINEPVLRTCFTNLSTNWLEGALFRPT
uniref:Uncharacterized protein n=1 Tax=Lepeophtheirus salmonis TaxID=72036 RepID=A0A0K2TGQ1_LEPSM